jgi:SAM-dependent methyltransferase
MNYICQVCRSNAAHDFYQCREKMLGWNDEFTYFQCTSCGCLQIAIVPADLSRFYPENYYSFCVKPFPQSGWKARMAGCRDFSAATGSGIWGKLLARITPARSDVASLVQVPAQKEMRILDVGCGRGQLLSILHRAGFSHLSGIDPYLPGDIEVVPSLWVRKQSLEQLSEQFDLIMLHHVFEHIESGQTMLKSCRQRLAPGGKILLRFPTPESEAWERYRENWVQIDAPRHLFLYTQAGLQVVAKKSGLKIENWLCDSSAFQFWGSELYRKGLSLYDPDGVAVDPKDHFTTTELKAFEDQSNMANAHGRGDQVVAVLSDGSIENENRQCLV